MKVKYYTDGSCRANGTNNAAGAYGYIIVDENNKIIKTFASPVLNTTNQKCEMMAILSACIDAKENYTTFDEIEIISDSAYCINCIHDGWYKKWQVNGWVNSKKEPVANRNLWEHLIEYFDLANFSFTKTRGHSDDEFNNKIDNIVQTMSDTARRYQIENNNN